MTESLETVLKDLDNCATTWLPNIRDTISAAADEVSRGPASETAWDDAFGAALTAYNQLVVTTGSRLTHAADLIETTVNALGSVIGSYCIVDDANARNINATTPTN